jgi:uncharacterized protein YaaQ
MFHSPAEFHSALDDPEEGSKKNTSTSALHNPRQVRAEGGPGAIRYLLGAVVQLQDLRKATRALENLGLSVTHLPSTGAFLGRRSVTLLIGLPEGMGPAVFDVIKETCHQRVEYISTPLEGAPMPIPLSTPITVGGATLFTLEIERYEEF